MERYFFEDFRVKVSNVEKVVRVFFRGSKQSLGTSFCGFTHN
jgi:hypothetical protein